MVEPKECDIITLTVELVKAIIAGELKTVIYEFFPQDESLTEPFVNNISDITCRFYRASPDMAASISTLMFGDDRILPESEEHGESLFVSKGVYTNNHITLSNDDNLNVVKIVNKTQQLICKYKNKKIRLIGLTNDGEEYNGYINISYSDQLCGTRS